MTRDETVSKEFIKSLKELSHEVLHILQEALMAGSHPRENYKELLELSVVVLGGRLKKLTFRQPGTFPIDV